VSDHDRFSAFEGAVERRDHLLLFRSVHYLSPVGGSGQGLNRRLHLAGPSSALRTEARIGAHALSPQTSPKRASPRCLVRTDPGLAPETGCLRLCGPLSGL